MTSDRLRQIEENLNLLREQQANVEREALLTTGLPRTQAEQRLRLDIKPKIREYEQEYWQILAANVEQLVIPEMEAETAVVEIVQQVAQLEVNQSAPCPDEMLQLLREIRDRLNQPGPSAAAKLKGIISSIPPFIGVSYEAELDTETFFRTHLPTFTRLIRGAAKK